MYSNKSENFNERYKYALNTLCNDISEIYSPKLEVSISDQKDFILHTL